MINAYVWQKYGKQQEKEEAAEAVLQYLPSALSCFPFGFRAACPHC